MNSEAETGYHDNTEAKTTRYRQIKKKINEAEAMAEIKRTELTAAELQFREEENRIKSREARIAKLTADITFSRICSVALFVLTAAGLLSTLVIGAFPAAVIAVIFLCLGFLSYPTNKIKLKKELQSDAVNDKETLSPFPDIIARLNRQVQQAEAEIKRLETEAEALSAELRRS